MGNILLTNGQSIPEDSIIFKVSAPIDNGIETKIPISLVQYDTSFAVIGFSILYRNSIMKLDDSYTISIRMKKPDGKEVYDQVIGFDQNNTVYILVTQQMTTAFGEGEICLELINGNNKKSTKSVPVYISENPVSEKNIESTDEYKTIVEIAAEVQQAAQLVQSQATNLQNVTNNLDAIKNASSNATAAQNAAEEAKVAAQQALGFRTFFSAVSPDANGDLDPSRPMTTPTAQKSWTIKSKGDRIQSVQVDGFTQQAGSGDPSPTHVREISTAGMRMVETTFDGSSDENWTLAASGTANKRFGLENAVPNALGGLGTCFANWAVNAFSSTALQNYPFANVYSSGYLDANVPGINTLPEWREYLSKNPLTLWYVVTDESQTTGLYVPIRAQGHEYRCQMLELTEPLRDGDKVESNVPSGCDKTLTFTGGSGEKWAQNLQSGAWLMPVSDIAAYGSTKIYSDYLPGNTPSAVLGGTEGISPTSGGGYIQVRLPGSATPSEYLPTHPLKVWYQSAAYTEANDLFVELETHTTGAIYAHPAVDLVAVPYTEADATAAQQLANTPSTLPYIDSADVPMLLDSIGMPEPDVTVQSDGTLDAENTQKAAEWVQETAQRLMAASLASAPPVAGTYVVSSQDGTTVLVSLKAMQDGGDAKTLEGMTIADINNNTTALLNDYIKIYQAQGVAVNVPTGQNATTAVANISSFDGYTPIAVLSAHTLNYGIVCAANYSVISNKAQVKLFNMTDTAQSNVWVYATILYIKT